MRILHILESFSYCDGCARHVYVLAREQHRAGHEVSVLHGGGDAEELLRRADVHAFVHESISHERRSILQFMRGAAYIRRLLRDMRPEIVHVHNYYAANLARLALAGRGAALIQTVHGNVTGRGRLPLHPAKHIIAVSEATRRFVAARDAAAGKRAGVVHCAVEFTGFADEVRGMDAFKALLARRRERFIVAGFGRFVEAKGFIILLHALALLKDSIPLTCVLAGSGDEEAALLRTARELGVDMVSFGLIRDVMPILEQTDVCVVPSLRMEGIPIVILEAGLMRMPVIATRIEGIPEAIEDGVTGLLVPPGDAPALADALRTLHSDALLRATLGKGLQGIIDKEFSIEGMTRHIAEIYQTALRSRTRKGDVSAAHPRGSRHGSAGSI
jgi:glycosyltransferase involved in cell wall biosynthesis